MKRLLLPREEGRPRLTIGVNAPHALVGWRHIEHHDVVGVIGQDTVHVALVHRPRPTLDQRSDMRLIVSHGFAPSRMPLFGGLVLDVPCALFCLVC